MKLIRTISLSLVLLLSAGSANAGLGLFDLDVSQVSTAVQQAEVGQSLKQNAEELLEASEVLEELTPKMVASKNFFLEYASLPFSWLSTGYKHATQMFSEADYEKLSGAAKRLGMDMNEVVKRYGKKAMELPAFAKKALEEQQIFSNKVTKIATVATVAVAAGVVVYKYDLHKKAYNGLVALKNKVFGKNETK